MIDPAARVHATADVASDAAIGPDVTVWDRAVVRSGAQVGAGTTVGRDVLVDEGVRIGTNVRIHTGALLYRGSAVGDGVYIGPRVILTNDRYPRAIHADGSPANGDEAEPGAVRIDHAASIGAGAIVMPGCEIGQFATVGAGAVVARSVPAHALVAGNPAHRIGWVCTCGARLHDAAGNPAPAEVERYAMDPFLACTRCARRFVYVPEDDALEERSGPAVGAGTAGPAS